MVIRTVAAFAAVVCFGLLLELPKRYLLSAGLVGGAAWMVYLIVEQASSNIMAAFVSTLAVALISHVFARVWKAPATIFLVAGILPAVPGASIYRSVYYIIQDNGTLANHYLMETLQIAGAIALAVFVMDSAFRLFQGHGKVEQSCRSHGNTGRPDWIDGLPEEHQRD